MRRRRAWWPCGSGSSPGSAASVARRAHAHGPAPGRPHAGAADAARPAARVRRRGRPRRPRPRRASASAGPSPLDGILRRSPSVGSSPPAAAERRRRPARRAPRRAAAPRPPCPAGRCRCRTWATARRTGSRSRTRSWRPSPGWRVSQSPQHGEPALGEAGAAGVAVVDEDRRRAGVRVQRGGDPADVPAVAGREQRQQPDRGVLGGVQRAGHVGVVDVGAPSTAVSSRVSQTARVRSWRAAGPAGTRRAPRRCRAGAAGRRPPGWSRRPRRCAR